MNRVAQEQAETLWDEFLTKLSALKSKEEIKSVLEKLISQDEKTMMLRRLTAVALIKSGKSYREIGEILWLSPNTISTIKKNLLGSHKNYKSYLSFYGGPKKYSGEIRIQKSFWEKMWGDLDIWDILMNPPRPQGIGLLNSTGVPKRSWNHRSKHKR